MEPLLGCEFVNFRFVNLVDYYFYLFMNLRIMKSLLVHDFFHLSGCIIISQSDFVGPVLHLVISIVIYGNEI